MKNQTIYVYCDVCKQAHLHNLIVTSHDDTNITYDIVCDIKHTKKEVTILLSEWKKIFNL